jgi:glycosyltransferase involved in cell wall biosynthesis
VHTSQEQNVGCVANNRLKIAVDLTPMLPAGENGGVKFAILELLRGLKHDFSDRLTFLFLTADDSHDEVSALLGESDSSVCVLRRRRRGFGKAVQALELATWAKLAVRKLVRQHHVALLYCPFGWTSFASATTPCLSLVVDLLHRDFPFSLPAQDQEWRELNFRKLVSCADYYQVISDFTGQRLQSLYNVPAQQIFRTYLPIQGRLSDSLRHGPAMPDLGGLAHSEKEQLEAYSSIGILPVGRSSSRAARSSKIYRLEAYATFSSLGAKQFFFYPANFWAHKNHELLLIAYQLYLAGAGDQAWDLVLTGYLDERAQYLQRVAHDLDILSRVKFLGYVPEATLAELYSAASCLVFPSLYEGFGIPIVEAMSFGLPIVCSREASIPEIAGEAALYADTRNPLELASALQRMTQDENLRNSLVELGRIQMSKFDFSAEVARLADTLFAAASGNPDRTKRYPVLQNLVSEGTYFGRALARQAVEAVVKLGSLTK